MREQDRRRRRRRLPRPRGRRSGGMAACPVSVASGERRALGYQADGRGDRPDPRTSKSFPRARLARLTIDGVPPAASDQVAARAAGALDGGPNSTLPLRATLQPGESAELGREARRRAPRSSHGEWAPAAGRPDPVAVLAGQAASRVQELVPIRYGRMLASPFTFYRGAAAVMAADLAGTPDSGIVVQACGDAHIANFGAFAAPDRRLVFSPNDFDETLPGPWEWDVKRLATSVEIAARELGLQAAPQAAPRHELRRRVPRGDAGLRERQPSGGLVPAPDGERARRELRRAAAQQGPDRVRQAVREGAAQDEREGGQEAHRARRRRAAVSPRPAAAGPGPRAVRRRAPRPGRVRARAVGRVRGEPAGGPPAPVRNVQVRRHGPQGRRHRQRRHARVGVPARRAGR